MVNCDAVYTKEGLRLPTHSVRIAVPVTDSAGNESVVFKRLQAGRKGLAVNRDDVVTEMELRELGGTFQIVVMTPDGPVAGLTIDPRNCFGTNGRKYDPQGPDGDPLRAMPAESRRALARQVLRGGISYGLNDAKLSAARLRWAMQELPFEEIALVAQVSASSLGDLLADPGHRDAQGRARGASPDGRLEESKALAAALVVRAAVEGTGFLREHPTLTMLLADHLRVSLAFDSPHWVTESNRRKLGAIEQDLASVSGEIYQVLVELENPQTRLAALASLGDSPAADKARAVSALFDPAAQVRSMAAAAIVDPSIRLEAVAVLSQLNVRDEAQDPSMQYRELLASMRDFDNAALQGLAKVVPLLPAAARAYVYGEVATTKFTETIVDSNTRWAIRNLLYTETDPVVVGRYMEEAVRQGDQMHWLAGSIDDGVMRRLKGASATEDVWVPSAAFDLFSADTAADVLIASYIPSPTSAAPCQDAELRAALIGRLLVELANPDLDGVQRDRYVHALISAAKHEPAAEIRGRILASESLASRMELEEVTSLYRRSARFETEPSLRSRAAAQPRNSPTATQSSNSSAAAQMSVNV